MAHLSMEQLRRFNEAKAQIRVKINHGVGEKTQSEILQACYAVVDNYVEHSPKQWPKYYATSLMEYTQGYFDGKCDGQTVFLYMVDGKFYRTSHTQELEFPVWNELPREQWDKLGDHGGLYWKTTLKPYFIG